MPYLESFALVIFSFYVLSSWRLVSPHTMVLRSNFGEPFRIHIARSAGLQLRQRLFATLATLLPFGRAAGVETPPFVLHDGVLYPTWAHSFAPNPTDEELPWSLPLSQLTTCEQDGRTLLLNGKMKLRLLSAEAAHKAKTLLVIEAGAARPKAVQAWFEASTDLATVHARQRVLVRAGWPLQLFCTALFALVFVLLPVLARTSHHPLTQAIGPWHLLSTYGVLWSGLASSFWLLHRRMYPPATKGRIVEVLGMLVSPADAMGAYRRMWWDAFASHHPLTVARALAKDAVFHDFAALVQRGLPWSKPPYGWPLVVSLVQQELERHSASSLPASMAVPVCKDSATGYCPRCALQVLESLAFCPDCQSVPILRLGT